MVAENAVENKRITILQGTALFGDLTPDELSDIAQHAVELHFEKGELLFLSGEKAKGIFVVVHGGIRVFQHDTEGREQVMHMDTAGSVIGEVPVFDDGPYPASAIAEVDVDVLFIEKRNVHQFCAKYPFLALKALRLMAKRVRKHAQLVEVLSFHDVAQRLAFFLLEECPSPPSHSRTRLHLQLSNHEIAVRIGSVRDVVSRAFAKLKHDGLIAVEDREVVIPDLHALRRYASNAGSRTAPRADSLPSGI